MVNLIDSPSHLVGNRSALAFVKGEIEPNWHQSLSRVLTPWKLSSSKIIKGIFDN